MDEQRMEAAVTECLKEILHSLRTSSTAEAEVSQETSQAHIENILERRLRHIGIKE